MVDKITGTAVGLFLIPLAAYIICFILQYKGLVEGAERINILNIRVALFLPVYAICMVICVGAPDALAAITIPLNLVESYSFYCFFVLLVTNAGGPAGMVQTMANSGKQIMCCNWFCPSSNEKMYESTRGALWHLIVTRNVITVIAAIADYSGSKAGRVIYALLSAVCTILLMNSLMRIFLTYEMIYASCANVFNVFKVMLLKFSISLIVLEGLIAQFMIAFGGQPYDDDNDWNKDDKTIRGYCSLVLIEFAILTLPYLFLWAQKVNPPAASTSDKNVTTAPLTFGEYCCKTTRVWDIFGVLPSSDLGKPINDSTQKV